MGIDPGTATTGFGILKLENDHLEALDWGLIETDKNHDAGRRFVRIYTQMAKILKNYSPEVIAIEKIFFATNAKTAIAVGQAQGVMLYCAARSNIKIFEYAPMTIKKIVSGSGKSDKKTMQQYIRKYFGARVRSAKKKRTHFDNAADALAVALCHAKTIDAKF
jgi:crossover junction endodeoxyribonuclease RuvC